MKIVAFIVSFALIAGSAVHALPTGEPPYSSPESPYSSVSPYEKCVQEHGGANFPYPGPGECHEIGSCTCNPDGSIACIC
ncbi:hypothetical protein GGI26_001331 [Coemansia sp. RSA 1358]|nr:hypothetical protein BX070DRAFT_220827 [Coemansia spiralis]KAJ2624637.1 hypothetical protein GGI26_001331 [Coemansia sp. RSA 1358]